MKYFEMRKLATALVIAGLIGTTSQAMASAFQIWEQDVVGLGNFHSGYAAEANTATIAWTNPAGMIRIQNQQLVLGTAIVAPHFKYRGSVGVTETLGTEEPFVIVTQANYPDVRIKAGDWNYVPNLQYVAPVNDWISFGFSAVVPFGLETDYGTSTNMKYAATKTSIKVIDFSPSFAFKLTDKASFGLGFDLQKAEAEFNSVVGTVQLGEDEVDPLSISDIKNKVRSTGYGYHLGALYEFTPCTRVGISYHSAVRHHFRGTSRLIGPIAEVLTSQTSDELVSRNGRANITLPAYTALSVFHQINSSWAIMGNVIYTQWHVIDKISFKNAAGAISAPFPEFLAPSTTNAAMIPI